MMSYFSPKPRQKPKRLPRRQPIKVVPSGIGDQGIVGNWLFYYLKGGDHLHDFSPYDNHGTINGAVWKDGRYGWALKNDGVNDYIEVPDDTSIKIKSEGTVFYWVKFLSFNPDSYEPVIGKGYHSFESWVDIVNPGGGSLYHNVWDPDAATRRYPHYMESTTAGKWYCLAATHSVSGGYVKTFLNGEYTGNSASLTSVKTGTYPLKIATSSGYNNYVNAIFALVSLYDVAKSASWIKRRFERTKGIFGK